MKKKLLSVFCAAIVVGTAQMSNAAISDTCSTELTGKRFTIVVPNAAGGGYDVYARALAPVIEAHSPLSVRVVNMPSGGGTVAPYYVAESGNDDMMALLQNSTDLVTTELEGSGENGAPREFLINNFDVVGIIQTEPGAWLGTDAVDLLDPARTNVVGSQGTLFDAIFPLSLTAMALGMTADVVTGYEGSSDQAAAVLRGEVEVTTFSLTSALKNAKSGDLKVLMVMSEGQWPATPEIPYLAGEGSVVWQLTENLAPEARDARRAMAVLAASAGGSVRGIHMSTNVSQERRDCVSEILSEALVDPAFIDAAAAQGRDATPIVGDAARALVAKSTASFMGSLDLFDGLVAAVNE